MERNHQNHSHIVEILPNKTEKSAKQKKTTKSMSKSPIIVLSNYNTCGIAILKIAIGKYHDSIELGGTYSNKHIVPIILRHLTSSFTQVRIPMATRGRVIRGYTYWW